MKELEKLKCDRFTVSCTKTFHLESRTVDMVNQTSNFLLRAAFDFPITLNKGSLIIHLSSSDEITDRCGENCHCFIFKGQRRVTFRDDAAQLLRTCQRKDFYCRRY